MICPDCLTLAEQVEIADNRLLTVIQIEPEPPDADELLRFVLESPRYAEMRQ